MIRPRKNGAWSSESFSTLRGQPIGQRHDDGEDHRRRAHHGGPDQHRFGGRLEGVARAIIFFQQIFGAFKIRVNVEILLEFRLDVGHLLDQRKFIDGLRVVGNRTVGIDGDGHRPHAEESESNQAESEHWRGDHGGCRAPIPSR